MEMFVENKDKDSNATGWLFYRSVSGGVMIIEDMRGYEETYLDGVGIELPDYAIKALIGFMAKEWVDD